MFHVRYAVIAKSTGIAIIGLFSIFCVFFNSGDLTDGFRSFTINSTKENIFLTLETDGGNNERGFLATWSPMVLYDKIEGECSTHKVFSRKSEHVLNFI